MLRHEHGLGAKQERKRLSKEQGYELAVSQGAGQ